MLVAVLLAVGMSGCSTDEEPDTAPPFAAGQCADFDRATIPANIEVGCLDGGTLQSVYAYYCADGRKLISAGPLMGFVGEDGTYLSMGEASSSQRFRTLMDQCRPAR
jgi:hypothetical protein